MPLKILLADDSMTAQRMGSKILSEAGHEVVAVSNGAAAARRLEDVKPDLVILDVFMPGYNGLELCERIKKARETANLPVLLTVGKLEPFRPEDGKRVRANGVVIKPFEASELLQAVTRIFQDSASAPSIPAPKATNAQVRLRSIEPVLPPKPVPEPMAPSPAPEQRSVRMEPESVAISAPAIQNFAPERAPIHVPPVPLVEAGFANQNSTRPAVDRTDSFGAAHSEAVRLEATHSQAIHPEAERSEAVHFEEVHSQAVQGASVPTAETSPSELAQGPSPEPMEGDAHTAPIPSPEPKPDLKVAQMPPPSAVPVFEIPKLVPSSVLKAEPEPLLRPFPIPGFPTPVSNTSVSPISVSPIKDESEAAVFLIEEVPVPADEPPIVDHPWRQRFPAARASLESFLGLGQDESSSSSSLNRLGLMETHVPAPQTQVPEPMPLLGKDEPPALAMDAAQPSTPPSISESPLAWTEPEAYLVPPSSRDSDTNHGNGTNDEEAAESCVPNKDVDSSSPIRELATTVSITETELTRAPASLGKQPDWSSGAEHSVGSHLLSDLPEPLQDLISPSTVAEGQNDWDLQAHKSTAPEEFPCGPERLPDEGESDDPAEMGLAELLDSQAIEELAEQESAETLAAKPDLETLISQIVENALDRLKPQLAAAIVRELRLK